MTQPPHTPLFGSSADKSALVQPTFGASTLAQSTAPKTFGSFSEKTSPGFGSFSRDGNQSIQSSTALFGSSQPGGFQTPSFGGLPSQTDVKPATFGAMSTMPIVFGGQPLFSSGNQTKGTTSNLFGKTSASGGSSSFSKGASMSAVTEESTPGLFGARYSTQSSNLFALSSNSTATSSNLFGSSSSFTSTRDSRSTHTSSLSVDDGDDGFRKRSSSGTMSSSVLFGKKQAAKAVTGGMTSSFSSLSRQSSQLNPEDTHNNPSRERRLFGKEPTSNMKSSQGLFGGKLPPYSESGANVQSTRQSMFMSSTSPEMFQSEVSSVREVPAFGPTPPTLFGKPSSGTTSTAHDSSTASSFPVAPSSSSSAAAPKLFGKANPPTQNLFGQSGEKPVKALFGKAEHGDSLRQVFQTSDSAYSFNPDQTEPNKLNLFGKADPPTQIVFGEGEKKTFKGLFGKDQVAATSHEEGAGLFPGGQVESRQVFQETEPESGEVAEMSKGSSPSKRSLSKWNRNRDSVVNIPKKRTGEQADSSDPKRVRGHELQAGVMTSPTVVSSRSRTSLTRQSVDDQSTKTSIIIKDIPVELNKGSSLRAHFSRFGSIKRLQPMPTKNAANITFHTHTAAKNAKEKGKHIRGYPPLSIFWRNVIPKSPSSTALRSPEIIQRQGKNQTEPQGGVQDELASMAGTFDYQEEFSPQESSREETHQKTEPKPVLPSSLSTRPAHTRSADRRSPTPPRRLAEDSESQGVADIEIAKKLLKVMWKAKPKDATETVQVLDARDKFLRLLHRRRSDLTSARAFHGTCEDMCSEKERYYREDIRRLALYEVIPSTMTSVTGLKSKVDHTRAVKEYSRSSADQEEPLPHELRPLPVLMTTMNYLLWEVADQGGEGKWSEWYDFLWNRTRGIRKDITQQQLCEVEVAQLLEKCTRFHIFCSARLCEEDMMSFDPKINNENLTKCLQTVKELYADLEKRKVYCPNEAEFRAYMVLMNLNEGDTLREVQQLRPEIRESAHIHFALKAYHALNSSNYVRFFRLIKDATFLNACILHRYFNQIRGQALRIIMKAHKATGKNRVMYPVGELIRLLGFEDSSQVEIFCDHYCLTVEGDDIVMDAQAFLEPESSILETRSQTLVEAKRTVTVGEIINGCPLPPLILPQPSSSFDSSGTFVFPQALQEAFSNSLVGLRSLAAAHHVKDMPAGPEDRHQPQELPPAEVRPGLPSAMEVQRGRVMFSNDAIKSEVRALILEELDNNMRHLATEIVEEERHLQTSVMGEVEDLAQTTVKELARDLVEEVIEEEEAKMQERLAQEMAAQRLRVFTSLCDGVVEDTASEMINRMAREEMELVTKELHKQCVERCSVALRDDLLSTAVEAVILDVAQEVFEVDVLAKRERLAATEACVLSLRCRRFFQMWQEKYLSQIRVKRAMLDFPSTAPNRQVKDQLDKLVPHRPSSRLSQGAFYISNRAKLRLQTPMEVIQQQLYLTTHLSMASARSMLASLVLWRPLDLSHTVTPQLYTAWQEWRDQCLIEPDKAGLQWKLCVSVPKKETSTTDLELNFVKWIKAKLCRDSGRDEMLEKTPSYEGEVLSLYHVDTDQRSGRTVPLSICIRAFHGKWTEDQEIAALNKSLLKGMSALLFVCSSAEDLSVIDPSANISAWKKERIRLHQMLKQKQKCPRVPLVLIVPRLTGESHMSTSDLDTQLELTQLRDSGFLSMVQVSHIYIGAQDHPTEFFSDWSSQLSNCLRFAATHVPTPPKLWAKPVSSYVESLVIELYKAPVYQDLRTRTRLQLLHQSPNTLISLYNEAIEHLALICASDDLRNVSWPAPEFDASSKVKQGLHPTSQWNTDSHLCNLYELVAKMRLPYFRYSDMEAQDWATACRDVWAFLDKVTKKDSGSAKIALYQQTAQLLIRTKKSFDQLCWLAHEDGPCEPTYVNMVWTDLVDACVHYKLQALRSGHMDIRKPDKDDDDQLDEKVEDFVEVVVYYPEDDLDDFEPPARWTDALRDTETADPGQLKPAVKVAAVKRDQTLLEESVKEREQIVTVTQETPASPDEYTDDTWAVLKLRLEQEKVASDSFQSSLAAALSPDDPTQRTTKSRLSPQSFEAFVSPILPLNQESSSKSSQNQRIFPSSGPNEPGLHATPRRPVVSFDKSYIRNTRRSQQSLTRPNPQGRTEEGNAGSEDMDTTEPALERNGLPWAECTMSEKVLSVQELVAAQKQEDLLFEIKLRRMMESSPLTL